MTCTLQVLEEKEEIHSEDSIIKLSEEDLERVKKKQEEEAAKLRERDERELKRLVEEKARWFKPVSKYKEADVLKWLKQQPYSKGKYNDTKVHPKLPKYLIQGKDKCKTEPVDFLFYFQSLSSNFEKRENLRKTWARTDVNIFRKIKVKVVFIVGETYKKEWTKKLKEESDKYHDIIQGGFNDTFRNISLKVLLMLDWVDHFCPQAKYIVKADDDMFLNPYLMIENMISLIWRKPKALMCHRKKDNSVITDKKSKWFIPENVLPAKHKKILPEFCAGYVAIFTGNLVPELRKAALTMPVLPVDDVYLFGFLMKDIKDITIMHSADHFTLNLERGRDEYAKYTREIRTVAAIAWQEGAMEYLWDKALDRLTPLGSQLVNPQLIPK